MITQKVLELSKWNLVDSSPINRRESLFVLVTEVKFAFRGITEQVLELSTWNLVQTLVEGQARCIFILGSLGVNCGGHCSITQNVWELPTWNLVQILVEGQARCPFILWSLGSILGLRGLILGSLSAKSPNCPDGRIMPAYHPTLRCYILPKWPRSLELRSQI